MATENKKASSIVSNTGFIGGSPTVGEVDTDDTTYAEPANNNTSIDLIVGFDTPTGNLNTGAGLQQFNVIVRQNAVSPGTGTATAQIELYENGNVGNPLATSSSSNITSTSGDTTITLTWDAALLTDVSGADVECHVIGNKSGGSPSVRISVAVDSIDWDVDYAVGGGDVFIDNKINSIEQQQGPLSAHQLGGVLVQ